MDPRVIPEKFLGIEDNPTAVLRNAGGRASDALRSLYVLNALREIGLIVVVHHTGEEAALFLPFSILASSLL